MTFSKTEAVLADFGNLDERLTGAEQLECARERFRKDPVEIVIGRVAARHPDNLWRGTMPINKFHEVAVLCDDNRRGLPGMLKDGHIVSISQAEFPHMASLDVKPVSQVACQPRR